jgi:hypothetical protein
MPRTGFRKTCYECQRSIDNARYAAPNSKKRASKLAHDLANHAAKRAYGAAYYAANRDKWLNSVTGWRFSERAKAYDAEYETKPENREAAKLRGKLWRQSNRPRLVLKTLARKAKVAQATPLWANQGAIRAIYEEAERKTLETGVKHEVDHYFPLVSPVVCGLHVEFNLRVITAVENRRKANKMPE